MAEAVKPDPVKLIVGVLCGCEEAFPLIRADLEKRFGPVDLESDVWEFNFTRYYEREMGAGLKRIFWSFERLIDPGDIAQIKRQTNELEKKIAERMCAPVPRPVNLDPGYISLSKLVLATTKDFSHRIYVGDGIYAEVTLRFRNGVFEFWPWTYPDYRTQVYRSFFARVRDRYLDQRKSDEPHPPGP